MSLPTEKEIPRADLFEELELLEEFLYSLHTHKTIDPAPGERAGELRRRRKVARGRKAARGTIQ